MQPENFDTDAPQLWSEKIEQQILGTLLVDFDADIMGEIDPGWFRLVKHQQIAKILRRRPDAAGNLEAIGDELKRAGELENAGGYGYLARLTASYAGRYAIQEHVKRLADYASRRRMIELASELARRAYNLQVEVGQTVGDIYSGLDSLALSTGEAAEHWKGALNRLYNYVEQRKDNPQDVYGVSVGLTDFDHLTGGLPS
jgi:replicative DNA helicase